MIGLNLDVDIQVSKSGLEVPIVDGIRLHSIYDPKRESLKFLTQNKANIASSTHFLIFGCGFGYHIQALIDYLNEQQRETYTIYIIEPNKNLYQKYTLSQNMIRNKNINYLVGQSENEIYEDEKFLGFLLHRPCLLPHPASFNLNKDYYAKILSFKSPDQLKSVIERISSQEIREYLKSFDQNFTFKMLTSSLKDSTTYNYKAADFFILAINELNKASRVS